jgi:hypothetical protein
MAVATVKKKKAAGVGKTREGGKTASARKGAIGRSAMGTKAATASKKDGKDLSASFNKFKSFNGKLYTGVQIGRGHHWHYDEGDWKETKITPDLWEVSYAVVKRRVGKAPDFSGVPVGTEYHWYILAHQTATKLDANDYDTKLTGLKFKIAHKRADKGKWSAAGPTQRKHLIRFLKDYVAQLEKDPVGIEFEYNGQNYKGEGVPIAETCADGVCYELDVMLNNEPLGIIRYMRSGWKMDLVKDQKLVDAIGEQIMKWFE